MSKMRKKEEKKEKEKKGKNKKKGGNGSVAHRANHKHEAVRGRSCYRYCKRRVAVEATSDEPREEPNGGATTATDVVLEGENQSRENHCVQLPREEVHPRATTGENTIYVGKSPCLR